MSWTSISSWADRPGMSGKVALVLMTCLVALAGCGKSPYLRVAFDRPAASSHASWVAVFLLNNATSLDDVSNSDLIERTEDYIARGVLHHEKFSVIPGDAPHAIAIPIENYTLQASWLVIVANVADPGTCSRYKLALEAKPRIDLAVTVEDQCLDVHSTQ